MEIKFTEALPLERTIKGGMAGANARGQVMPPITVIPNGASTQAGHVEETEAAKETQNSNPWGFEEDAVKDMVKQASELLSAFDRQLRYELREEAGVVQIQVVDSRDGRVVRKIPADEVIKFIEQMKEQIDDRVDLIA